MLRWLCFGRFCAQRQNGAEASPTKGGLSSKLRSPSQRRSRRAKEPSTGNRTMIKMPFQIALEEQNALGAGKKELQAQQREM